jgi:hypothetical protein
MRGSIGLSCDEIWCRGLDCVEDCIFAVILWLSRGVGCSVMGRRFGVLVAAMHIWWEYVGVVVSMCAAFRTVQSWILPPDGLQSVSIHIMNMNK